MTRDVHNEPAQLIRNQLTVLRTFTEKLSLLAHDLDESEAAEAFKACTSAIESILVQTREVATVYEARAVVDRFGFDSGISDEDLEAFRVQWQEAVATAEGSWKPMIVMGSNRRRLPWVSVPAGQPHPQGSLGWLRARMAAEAEFEARRRIEDDAAAGTLCDVCDALFEDDERTAKHGYDGVLMRAVTLVMERDRLLQGLTDLSVERLASDLQASRKERHDLGNRIAPLGLHLATLAATEGADIEAVDDPEALEQLVERLQYRLQLLQRVEVHADPVFTSFTDAERVALIQAELWPSAGVSPDNHYDAGFGIPACGDTVAAGINTDDVRMTSTKPVTCAACLAAMQEGGK